VQLSGCKYNAVIWLRNILSHIFYQIIQEAGKRKRIDGTLRTSASFHYIGMTAPLPQNRRDVVIPGGSVRQKKPARHASRGFFIA
jgi:hypothetical protein